MCFRFLIKLTCNFLYQKCSIKSLLQELVWDVRDFDKKASFEEYAFLFLYMHPAISIMYIQIITLQTECKSLDMETDLEILKL